MKAIITIEIDFEHEASDIRLQQMARGKLNMKQGDKYIFLGNAGEVKKVTVERATDV